MKFYGTFLLYWKTWNVHNSCNCIILHRYNIIMKGYGKCIGATDIGESGESNGHWVITSRILPHRFISLEEGEGLSGKEWGGNSSTWLCCRTCNSGVYNRDLHFFNPLQRTGICASSSNLEIGEEVLFVLSLYEEEAAACSSWILFAKLKPIWMETNLDPFDQREREAKKSGGGTQTVFLTYHGRRRFFWRTKQSGFLTYHGF
jgi:hypothetical protein